MSAAPDLVAGAAAALDALRSEGASLLDLVPDRWASPAPGCPGWSAGDVATHTASVHRRVAHIVRTGERIDRADMPGPPAEPAAALSWCHEGLDLVVTALDGVDPAATTWTFSPTGERRVAWWHRRMAQETAVHRWDVAASGIGAGAGGDAPPAGIPPEAAVAGIDEYLTDFLPRMSKGPGSGTLHLHTTDADGEWYLDLADRAGSLRREHAKAATALRGPASDLLLWLWNRQPAAGHLEVFGDEAVVAGWGDLAI